MIRISCLLLLIFAAGNAASQQNSMPEFKSSDRSFINDSKKSTLDDNKLSYEIITLQQNLFKAKLKSDKNEMEALQKQLDALTGSITMKPGKPGNCFVISSSNPPFMQNSAAIGISQIFSGNWVKAIATATKQVPGDNEGEIWVAIARGEPTFNTDTLLIYKSTDNGLTWLLSGWTFFPGSTFNEDELDMEIIENNTADRYIWVVFGRTQGLQKKVGVAILKANSSLYSFDLAFPEHANLKYYRPRITSDNAAYYTNAWVYIIAARDSIMPGIGYYISSDERAALVLNPYTIFPSVTLKPTQFGYKTTCTPSPSFRNYPDIAYYHNGGDSIIVTESNLPDSSAIYLARTSITNFTGSSTYAWGGIFGNNWKTHARVATNGGYKEIMIVCDERIGTSGNWDIPYYYSTNGGNGPWPKEYIDSRLNISLAPDLVGRRNVFGKYYVSYLNVTGGTFDSVTSCTATNGVWGNLTEPVNHLGSAHKQPPKPGIRFVNNDSCLTIWSKYSSTTIGMDVFASNGCTLPVITGINNQIGIPSSYSLRQNYPNPFNPNTSISFDIPISGFVRLEIYNLIGEKIAEMLNKYLAAGTYNIEWDASSYPSGLYFYKITSNAFTDTKKMILIK